ncbi:MAG: dTDP-4-dehydrorhamnose reductase [Candidatus Omnitrophica bacterium]|nr:dTDP-4-dehydrorhamnose reductase [Candidatus Omnitrophota bacterium]
MKKILITGSNGLLGKALCITLKDKFKVSGLSSSGKSRARYIKCDIRRRNKLVTEFLCLKPDIVVHAAAMSDVDYCQMNPREASAVNSLGTRNVAYAAKKSGAFLIYISTDYVFNGRKKRPYREADKTSPISIYGKTKLEGEEFVKRILDKYLIIRTSWLFGPGRDNFVTKIIQAANKVKNMKIVADKFGSPTYSYDLASAIRDIISLNSGLLAMSSVVHISNSGSCSRFAFAKKIFKYTDASGVKIAPIKASEFSWSAERPAYSVLDNSKFKNIIGSKLRPWQEALREYLQMIDKL